MQLDNDSSISYNQVPTQNQQEKYKKIKVLGEGSMGKVYLVKSFLEKGKLYVMKRINIGHLDSKQKEQALLEAQLHNMVKHQNIIQFKQIYHTTKDKICIIMQYAQGGDLDQLIKHLKSNKKNLSEDQILKYFTQICLALKQIHDKKIVHRDLKGANIFLTKDSKIKVGDFGISKTMDKTVLASKSFVGTPFYLSPQMVQGKNYSTKADIWALGVILYHMSALKLPFDANSLPVLALKILKGAYPQLPNNSYSKQLKNLIFGMLQVDQRKRLSIHEILSKPILSKYLPKQFVTTLTPNLQVKVQLKTDRLKAMNLKSKNQSKQQTQKLSQQERKRKRVQEKIKREEERKKMRQDIKTKRNQGILRQAQENEQLQLEQKELQLKPNQSIPFQSKLPSKTVAKPILTHRNIKQQLPKSPPKNLQKPWKIKNLFKQKKQPQIQILVPGQKEKIASQVEQPKKRLKNNQNFDVQIFVRGQNPYDTDRLKNKFSSPLSNSEMSEKQRKNLLEESESSHDFSQQIEEIIQSKGYHEKNFEQVLANVKKAQHMVKNLSNPYQKNQIQLYQESADFDNGNIFSQPFRNPQKTAKKFEKNQSEMENLKYITNISDTESLEELRQILEDRLGEQNFIKALNILKQHFQEIHSKKTHQDTEDSEAYLFNRNILKLKLAFLSHEEFERNIELLYTISVMEDLEMMKNFSKDSELEDHQGFQSFDQQNNE